MCKDKVRKGERGNRQKCKKPEFRFYQKEFSTGEIGKNNYIKIKNQIHKIKLPFFLSAMSNSILLMHARFKSYMLMFILILFQTSYHL